MRSSKREGGSRPRPRGRPPVTPSGGGRALDDSGTPPAPLGRGGSPAGRPGKRGRGAISGGLPPAAGPVQGRTLGPRPRRADGPAEVWYS